MGTFNDAMDSWNFFSTGIARVPQILGRSTKSKAVNAVNAVNHSGSTSAEIHRQLPSRP